MATSPQLRSLPAPVEPSQARPERGLTRAEPELALAEPTAASLAATLRESKEILFILLGITLAFTIHFGFGDFVRTESSTPKVRSPLAANEAGNSARVRAAAFERAGERTARRRQVARRNRARNRARRRAAAAPPAAAAVATPTRTSSPARSSTPSAAAAPAPAQTRAPAPRPAPSKPRSTPSNSGGGQSFDDSG